MYTDTDFRTKKAFKEAVASGKPVSVYRPGGMFAGCTDGEVSIEGPHYPRPHTWYARCRIVSSQVVPGSVR